MQLHPKSQPKRDRVQVRLVEYPADGGRVRNKSFTVYDASLEDVYTLLQQAVAVKSAPVHT